MSLEKIRIVLVEPSHPGNIGAVARAMKTMGLTNLALVKPKKFPHCEATNRAAGAESVLLSAMVVDDIHQATDDCQWVLGTSVRDREVTWPTVDPKQMAQQVMERLLVGEVVADKQEMPPIAILFGRENSGLSNEELDLCHAQIRISSDPEYSSLNLGSAVQIMVYEIRMAYLALLSTPPTEHLEAELSPKQARQVPANMAEQTRHLAHLQDVLLELDFVKTKPPTKLMRKLTRLYNKANLTVEEIHILRGILTATQTIIQSNINQADVVNTGDFDE